MNALCIVTSWWQFIQQFEVTSPPNTLNHEQITPKSTTFNTSTVMSKMRIRPICVFIYEINALMLIYSLLLQTFLHHAKGFFFRFFFVCFEKQNMSHSSEHMKGLAFLLLQSQQQVSNQALFSAGAGLQ